MDTCRHRSGPEAPVVRILAAHPIPIARHSRRTDRTGSSLVVTVSLVPPLESVYAYARYRQRCTRSLRSTAAEDLPAVDRRVGGKLALDEDVDREVEAVLGQSIRCYIGRTGEAGDRARGSDPHGSQSPGIGVVAAAVEAMRSRSAEPARRCGRTDASGLGRVGG